MMSGEGIAASFDDGLADTIIGLGDDDQPYPISKRDAHRQSTRHLAVSIFLMRREKLLLQRRAAGKYHAPLLWANTACSHPLWGEPSETCVARTLQRELGFQVPVHEFAQTHYETEIGDLFENETVHCFSGDLDPAFQLPPPNRDEVDALCWTSLAELRVDLAAHPHLYAPWLRIYAETGILDHLIAPSL